MFVMSAVLLLKGPFIVLVVRELRQDSSVFVQCLEKVVVELFQILFS